MEIDKINKEYENRFGVRILNPGERRRIGDKFENSESLGERK